MLDHQAVLNEALIALDVHSCGEVTSPEEGLIASNFFVDTVERGKIVVRTNELGTHTGVGFEGRVLDFLAHHNAPVPSVLAFNGNSFEKHIGNQRVIAYVPIEGDTLHADEIDNTELAREAGALLNRLIRSAEQYEPRGDEPDGDINFIRKITATFLTTYPDFVQHPFFESARANLEQEDCGYALKKSPQGIVHADFFYENIIQRDEKLVGVIDFGDAYYGALINDIAIGAMEFSVLEESERWKPELFEAFLKPNATWLRENAIRFETFQYALLANCLRFVVYTLGFEREDDHFASADQNRYVQRYFKFKGTLAAQLQKSYEDVYHG